MKSISWLLIITLAGLGWTTTPAAPSGVVGVSPSPNATRAAERTPVVLTLDRAVDPAAFDSGALAVFGRWSGVAEGNTSVSDDGREIRFEPTREFQAGEQVTASLRAGLRRSNGSVSEVGYSWSFWIASAPGSLEMTDRGGRTVMEEREGHVQPYGAYAGDFNGDGYSDLAIPNEVSADVRIMLNDGTGNYDEFTVLAMPMGEWPSPSEGADFNGDGEIDFAVGNAGNDLVTVFDGDGAGGFRVSGNYSAGDQVRGVCILDLNGDGHPDVATANMGEGSVRERRGTVSLLMNDGAGALERTGTIESPGRGEKTCASADFNGDGLTDLAVGAFYSNEVLVYLGDGRGGLELASRSEAGGHPWMIVAADVNGDGRTDVLSANRERNNVALLFGDGAGGLGAPTTYAVGAEPLAVDVGDLDGDGDLDVVTSEFASSSFTIYENAGDGTLVNPRKLGAGASGSCAIIHDRDRDGDLDITGVDEIDDRIFLFENPGV